MYMVGGRVMHHPAPRRVVDRVGVLNEIALFASSQLKNLGPVVVLEGQEKRTYGGEEEDPGDGGLED